MTIDEQVLDLLLQWEEMSAKRGPVGMHDFPGGDANLQKRFERHLAALERVAWLNNPRENPQEAADVKLALPSRRSLDVSLLLPDGLAAAQLQANVKKADVVAPDKLQALLDSEPQLNAVQLSQRLLETGLLTRFQLQRIAHGRTRGLKLGRYVILDKLGEGGMGQVYKARHSRMERVVAVKVLPRDAMKRANGVARFSQEVSVASKLSHPNVVTAYDADEAEGLHFLVMEYVDGRDLSSVVRREGPLSTANAVDCILQAARGLEYAHGVGLVHRDIKPANLLLNGSGVVKVLDMGIARIQGSESAKQANITQNGAVMGTVDFMAPEQAVDAKTVDARADLYSLGCTLYYLLTSQPPFAGETLMQKLLGHREQTPPALQAFRSDVPPALEAIYQKCMAKLPADRYQTAAELITDLEQVRPQLSDGKAPMSLATIAADAETSPTGFQETQQQIVPDLSLAAQISLVTTPKEKRSPKKPLAAPMSFYGSVVGVALLLFGGYFALGTIFSISTPDGTLVVEVEGNDFETRIRGQELTLVNLKTNDSTKIRLNATEQTQKLSPGEYRFAVETNSGLRTDVDQLTITSGADSRIHAYWEPRRLESHADPADARRTELPSRQSKLAMESVASDVDGKLIDVLAKVRVPDHAFVGEWEQSENALIGKGGNSRRIMAPVALDGSYVMSVEFTRSKSDEPLGFHLPVGDSSTTVVLAGWQGRISGIGPVDGRFSDALSPASGAMSREVQVVGGKRHRFEVAVRLKDPENASITAKLDDQPFVQWSGAIERLGEDFLRDSPFVRVPGIWADGSPVEFLAWEIETLAGGRLVPLSEADWTTPFTSVTAEPPAEIASQCQTWDGKSYYVAPKPLTRRDAMRLAETLHGRILTISSEEEEDFIRRIAPGGITYMAAWRHSGSGEWRDERNRPLRYLGTWGESEPNNLSGRENFLALVKNSGKLKWHDVTGDGPWYSACSIIEWGEEYADESGKSPLYELKKEGTDALREALLSSKWNYRDSLYPPGGPMEFFPNGKFSSRWKWNYWIVGPHTMHVQFWDADYAPEKSVVFHFNSALDQFEARFGNHYVTGYKLAE